MIAFPFNVTVNPSVPARSMAELIALAKAQPGKLFYASIGVGGGHHLVTEMFKTQAGIDMVHIPFKGNPQAQARSSTCGPSNTLPPPGAVSFMSYRVEGNGLCGIGFRPSVAQSAPV